MAEEKQKADFEETIREGISLVDFWAPWCGPCRIQGPIVEKLSDKYEGKALIGKLNVDDNREIAEKFGVQSIPTLILFGDGKEIQRFVGVQNAEILSEALDKALGSKK